jgi:hypothetical protein
MPAPEGHGKHGPRTDNSSTTTPFPQRSQDSVKEGNRLGRRVAGYILDHQSCRADEECKRDSE